MLYDFTSGNSGIDDATNDPTLAINLKDLPSALDSFVAIAPNPGSKAFRAKFEKTFPNVTFQGFAASGYDSMTALLRALAAAGPGYNGTAVAAALQKQRFTGISSEIEFDEFGDLKPVDAVYTYSRFSRAAGVEPEVQGTIKRTWSRRR